MLTRTALAVAITLSAGSATATTHATTGLCAASAPYCMGYIHAVQDLVPLREYGVCPPDDVDVFEVIYQMEPLMPGTDTVNIVLDALRLVHPCS